MSNTWSGGQYSVVRVIFGLYLLAKFSSLISFDPEIASSTTAVAMIGAAASFALLIGSHDRLAAYVLAAVWTSVFVRSPLFDPSSPLVVVGLLLIHAFVQPRPFGSWDARGRVDPDSGWQLSPAIYTAAWIVLVLGIVESGFVELAAESWTGATGLAAALVIFAVAMWNAARRWLWFGLLCAQIVFAGSIEEQGLNAGLLLMQLFTFDPSWVPARIPENSAKEDHTLIFYDGSCGLCHRTIRFLLAEDAAGLHFRYAPLDSEAFRSALLESRSGFGPDDAVPDSVVVHRPGVPMLTRAAGALEIGHRLGGIWRLVAIVVGWLPMSMLNGGYDFIARVRHRVFTKPSESCPLIPAELRDRFQT
jgi:predicted DCC family thiol-disulfide oxidoreductase YuxK